MRTRRAWRHAVRSTAGSRSASSRLRARKSGLYERKATITPATNAEAETRALSDPRVRPSEERPHPSRSRVRRHRAGRRERRTSRTPRRYRRLPLRSRPRDGRGAFTGPPSLSAADNHDDPVWSRSRNSVGHHREFRRRPSAGRTANRKLDNAEPQIRPPGSPACNAECRRAQRRRSSARFLRAERRTERTLSCGQAPTMPQPLAAAPATIAT